MILNIHSHGELDLWPSTLETVRVQVFMVVNNPVKFCWCFLPKKVFILWARSKFCDRQTHTRPHTRKRTHAQRPKTMCPTTSCRGHKNTRINSNFTATETFASYIHFLTRVSPTLTGPSMQPKTRNKIITTALRLNFPREFLKQTVYIGRHRDRYILHAFVSVIVTGSHNKKLRTLDVFLLV